MIFKGTLVKWYQHQRLCGIIKIESFASRTKLISTAKTLRAGLKWSITTYCRAVEEVKEIPQADAAQKNHRS